MSNMDASNSSMSMSRDASQAKCIDPLDSLIDFSQYDDNMGYNSPSVSPTDAKDMFVQPEIPTSRANSILPSQQTLSGPSHPYDMHKQQTGLPTGGLATTMAINSNQQMMMGYGYLSGVSPETDFVANTPKFSSNPSSGSFESMNMVDYESPADPSFFFPPLPSANAGQEFVKPSNLLASNNNGMHQQQPGRIWPGMHQQQAMAKAQMQQKQQMQQRAMQPQRQGSIVHPTPQQKSRVRPATDPIVEEKISQLLNSMRQKSMASTADDDDEDNHHGNGHHGRSRKDEEDMDEDERLLASEEGKKLSSKERRQLRNKVSARAFRSRRKEYIGQLEGEIAAKVNENQRLFAENKALVEENDRLTDLTRLLLGSPAFSSFLNDLSTNPTIIPQQQRQQPTPPNMEQQQRQSSVSQPQQGRKDVNPYTAQQQQQQQQNQNDMNINYAVLPEQPMDFSMLDLANQDYMFQPQVFSVHSVPEFTFDSSVLFGKPSEEETFAVEEEKETLPVFAPAKSTEVVIEEAEIVVDDEFDSNPQFELFATSTTTTPSKSADEEPLDIESIVANIKPAKAFLNFEPISEQEINASKRRVKQLYANLDAVTARLEKMSCQ